MEVVDSRYLQQFNVQIIGLTESYLM